MEHEFNIGDTVISESGRVVKVTSVPDEFLWAFSGICEETGEESDLWNTRKFKSKREE